MGFLKWIGYFIVSAIGLCIGLAVMAILYVIGMAIGTIAVGLFAVVLIAVLINEIVEGK